MRIQDLFFNILAVIGCIILLYLGLKLTKHRRKRIKIIGYFFILVGLLALFADLYVIISLMK